MSEKTQTIERVSEVKLATPTEWTLTEAQRVAKGFVMSRLFSGDGSSDEQVAQAVVRISLGHALGITPAVAMSQIYVVKGKPMMGSSLIASLIKRSGKYDYRVKTITGEKCVIEFLQGSEHIGTSEYTMNDARMAGLAGGNNYKGHPRNMLFARAMSNGARWFCPDVFCGAIYDEFEMPMHEAATEFKPLDVPALDEPVIEQQVTPPEAPAETEAAMRERLQAKGYTEGEIEQYVARKFPKSELFG